MFEFLIIPLVLLVLLLILAIPLIIIYLFFSLTAEAFRQVGFGHWHATLMVFGSIVGSVVDIPLLPAAITSYPPWFVEVMSALGPIITFPATFHPVILAVNLGGCLIPVLISMEILLFGRVSPKRAFMGTLVVALVTYKMAIPVANEGILLPFYIPPVLAAVCGLTLARRYKTAPALAYICGSMGTLLGADIFSLLTPGMLPTLAPPGIYEKPLILSIGGAGVFDGIFLTGVLAVLLAAMIVHMFHR